MENYIGLKRVNMDLFKSKFAVINSNDPDQYIY